VEIFGVDWGSGPDECFAKQHGGTIWFVAAFLHQGNGWDIPNAKNKVLLCLN
jgi:hypothetical protein